MARARTEANRRSTVFCPISRGSMPRTRKHRERTLARMPRPRKHRLTRSLRLCLETSSLPNPIPWWPRTISPSLIHTATRSHHGRARRVRPAAPTDPKRTRMKHRSREPIPTRRNPAPCSKRACWRSCKVPLPYPHWLLRRLQPVISLPRCRRLPRRLLRPPLNRARAIWWVSHRRQWSPMFLFKTISRRSHLLPVVRPRMTARVSRPSRTSRHPT